MKHKYYNKFFPVLLLLFISLGSFAQKKSDQKLDIRALKIEYVVDKLSLPEDQNRKFLIIYNRYSDELLEIRRAKRNLKNNQNSDYVVEQRQILDQKIVSIKGKYKSEFLKVINSEQLNTLYKSEDEFKKLLIERLRKGK